MMPAPAPRKRATKTEQSARLVLAQADSDPNRRRRDLLAGPCRRRQTRIDRHCSAGRHDLCRAHRPLTSLVPRAHGHKTTAPLPCPPSSDCERFPARDRSRSRRLRAALSCFSLCRPAQLCLLHIPSVCGEAASPAFKQVGFPSHHILLLNRRVMVLTELLGVRSTPCDCPYPRIDWHRSLP